MTTLTPDRLTEAAASLLAALDNEWLWIANEPRRMLGDPREALRAALATRPEPGEPPPGTRLILASENLLEFFGTRTEDGRHDCPACGASLAMEDTHWSLFGGLAGEYVCPVVR